MKLASYQDGARDKAPIVGMRDLRGLRGLRHLRDAHHASGGAR